MSEVRIEHEIDRQCQSHVVRMLYQSAVVKTELSIKAKLSIYLSVCVHTQKNEVTDTSSRN